MKNLRNFALAAFALLGFAACQQEEFAPEIKNPTHSVTFVAGAPETKTTVDISDEKTAKFAWTKDDEGRIAIYENGVAATTVVCGLDDKTGKMTIMAEFKGTATGNETYVAVVNKSNDGQIMTSAAYDEDADILVSKAVSTFDGENGVLLQFKREVAIAKMTLKGLDPGEVVNHVTVSSTADIAGKYGVDGWASPAKSLEISSASYMGETDGYSIVSNASGEAVVWFTCIPQDAATLTVKVKAADGDTYTKEFSKEITLTRGDVKAFGVKMTKDTPKTYGYQKISSVEDYAPGDYIIVAHAYKNDCPTKGDFAIANNLTLSSDKLEGNDVTTLIDNDVISESDGASYKLSLSGDKDNIVISNGTNVLALAKISKTDLVLNGENKYWTLSLNTGNGGTFKLINNSTAKASTIRALSFQSYTTNNTVKIASLKFGAYAAGNINSVDYAAIELYKYQEVSPSTPKYSISFAEVTGGTLSATPSKAEAGAEVTLTATPDAGYEFNNDWTVKDADGAKIDVYDGKFTMPAQNVTVSGTFSKVAYTITKAAAENGSFTVKNGTEEVTTAFKGDKLTLEAIPAEGFTFGKWTVTYMDGETEKSFNPSANTFNMPAANVTVSATFVEAAAVPVYASVAELIAAGKPTTDGTKVTVTLKDEEITKFYKTGTYTNGVYFMVGTQEVQIYCWNTPSDWEVGGTISGTLTNCDWKLFVNNNTKLETWELCPSDYSKLTYKAPLPTCATPVITIAENGVVSITCETTGATIHYTVGNTPADPTEDDAVFGTVTLTDGQTIKAIAVAENFKPSAVASKKYVVGGSALAEKTATITFGANNVEITKDKNPVTANDDQNNSWTITTTGKDVYFASQNDCAQVGSKNNPATSITFTTTLPEDAEVTSISAKFGGYSKTAGTVTLKVGETSVGTGNLNETNDVTVTSTATAVGNKVTITVTGIANGVKCYNIQVKYKTAK